MALGDIFKGKQYKQELEDLKQLLTPEGKEITDIQAILKTLKEDRATLEKEVNALQLQGDKIKLEIENLNAAISERRSLIICLDDDILVQEFGLYTPVFPFMNVAEYKERLQSNRTLQKESIKNGTAVTGNTDWAVNGSKSQGNKMVMDMQKLLLRAFNSECDELVNKVKYNNFDAILKRMGSSKDAISKLGSIMGIAISSTYFRLKVEELQLALEYQIKRQEEKEEQKEARARLREASKLQKEIEEQRKKVEKEQTHYQKALIDTIEQLKNADESHRDDLLSKKSELEKQLNEIEKTIKDIDYREANERAGYVYVISNIGSFGKDIYKIGMTRRLEPKERVDELGDASVPFNFDIHAMIFSDDAPSLESALHKAFSEKKVNMVNQRREFFNVTLDEIKNVIKQNFDKTVEFYDVPEAEQYRISQKIKEERGI